MSSEPYELADYQADMFTTVFIGNSQTRNLSGKMVTPRGIRMSKLCVFAGTLEGRRLIQALSGRGLSLTASVATGYGESLTMPGRI